jgi:hypothetical protein
VWLNIKTLWSEMSLFRYVAMFFAIGAVVLLSKIL